MFLALLVTSTYTANLAAFVTVSSIRSSVASVAVRAAAADAAAAMLPLLLPPLRLLLGVCLVCDALRGAAKEQRSGTACVPATAGPAWAGGGHLSHLY